MHAASFLQQPNYVIAFQSVDL